MQSPTPHVANLRSGPLRVFFALRAEGAARRALWRIGQRLPAAGRAVAESDLHVTLLFLGRIGETSLTDLLAQAARVRAPRFELRFDHLASWNGGRIVCVTAPAVPALSLLHRRLVALTRSLHQNADARELRPHVTLRRDMPPALARTLGSPIRPTRLTAVRFALLSSNLAARGPRYEVLASWPLG